LLDDRVLEAGSYSVLIEPVWDDSAELSEEYRNITIDFYCTQEIHIKKGKSDIL
jgi:hypothetical protein